jgi:hypothetical protein
MIRGIQPWVGSRLAGTGWRRHTFAPEPDHQPAVAAECGLVVLGKAYGLGLLGGSGGFSTAGAAAVENSTRRGQAAGRGPILYLATD